LHNYGSRSGIAPFTSALICKLFIVYIPSASIELNQFDALGDFIFDLNRDVFFMNFLKKSLNNIAYFLIFFVKIKFEILVHTIDKP